MSTCQTVPDGLSKARHTEPAGLSPLQVHISGHVALIRRPGSQITTCVQNRKDSGKMTVTLCLHGVDIRDVPKTKKQFGFVYNGGMDLALY